MLRLTASLLLILLISLSSAAVIQQNDTLSGPYPVDGSTNSSDTSLSEPLIHRPNIYVRPILNYEGPKPVRMQRGQSAYALLVCASKTWRMEHAKQMPVDSLVRDDWFPQNVTFKLYVTRSDATTQVGGWACIMMLESLLRASAANPDLQFWDVPTMHLYSGNEDNAFGKMTLVSNHLPPQLGANDTEGELAQNSTSSGPIAQTNGVLSRIPGVYTGTVTPFKRFARRDGSNNTAISGPLIGDDLGDEPESTELKWTQSYSRQWISPRSEIMLLLEYLKEVVWQHHPKDPISEFYAGGETWDSQSIGLGQRLQVKILQVASGETNVLWQDVGMYLKGLLLEPTIQNKWKGWTSQVSYYGHKEPWMEVKLFVGRPGGLEVGDGETGVAAAASS